VEYPSIQSVISRARNVSHPSFQKNANWAKFHSRWLSQHYLFLKLQAERNHSKTLDNLHKALFEREIEQVWSHTSPIRSVGLRTLDLLEEFHLSHAIQRDLPNVPVEDLHPKLIQLPFHPSVALELFRKYSSNLASVRQTLLATGSSSFKESLMGIDDVELAYEALASMEGLTLSEAPQSSPSPMNMLLALINTGWGVYAIAHDIPIRDSVSVLQGITQVVASYDSVRSEINPKLVSIGRSLRKNRKETLDQWLTKTDDKGGHEGNP
jgi:hypothetical protein